jgi:predicted RNA binding protein with dsRBD fold (UPF0201 family)
MPLIRPTELRELEKIAKALLTLVQQLRVNEEEDTKQAKQKHSRKKRVKQAT